MNTDTPENSPDAGHRSKLVPTVGIMGEIIVNLYLIWFLLIDIPAGCARLAAETAGSESCGIETGAYVIAGISVVLILAGLYFLAKWYVQKK